MEKKKNKKYPIIDCFKCMVIPIMLEIVYIIGTALVGLYLAQVFGSVVDNIVALTENGMGFKQIIKEIFTIVVIIICNVLVLPIIGFFQERSHLYHAIEYKELIVEKYLNMEFSFAKTFEKGEVQQRLETDLNRFRWSMSDVLVFGVSFIVISIVFLPVLFENFIFGIIVVGASILPMLIAIITRKLHSTLKEQDGKFDIACAICETELYSGFQFYKTNNLFHNVIGKIKEIFNLYNEKTVKVTGVLQSSITLLNGLTRSISKVVVLIVGAFFLVNGKITIGTIVEYLGYISIVQIIVEYGSKTVNEFAVMKRFRERILLFYTHNEISGDMHIKDIEKISTENLGFSYNDGTELIKYEDIDIKHREKVVIKGENGTGKTTLLNIIASLFYPFSGTVQYNENDFSIYERSILREKISFLEQDVHFIDGTIKDNIDISNSQISDEDIVEIMKILNLNKSLDFCVKNNGENLSGGERRKLAICRTLLKPNAQIIILDEPTNDLDEKSKKQLWDYLQKLPLCVVIVSHDNEMILPYAKNIELKHKS